MSLSRAEQRRSADARDVAAPRLWPLAVVAALVTALGLTGVVPRWPGLPQLVALPPVDLFTDLRLLLTGATSVPAFLLLVTLVVGLRIAVLAMMLGGLTRDRLLMAARFYGIVFLPLLLAAQLSYVAFAVLYARLFWFTLAGLALLVITIGALPWQGSTRLRSAFRQSWRAGMRIGVLLAYTVVLIAIGIVAETWPGLAVPLIPVSAAATATTIRQLARRPRGAPTTQLALCAIAIVGAGAAVATTREEELAPLPPPREGSLLVMSGINSASGDGRVFHIPPERYGLTCDQLYYFSYAGPGDGQPRGAARCPIRTGAPFIAKDTRRPMAEQAATLAAQVRDLPRPLMVMGHSHSAWVAWMAVAGGSAPEVDVLILIGPLPESIQGYPPPGESGLGRVAGDLLRLMAPLSMGFNFDPDAPASLETLADPGAPARIFASPLPAGVRAISLTAATDLVLLPSGWRLPVEYNACPVRADHPTLPTAEAVYREVNRFLDGKPPAPCPVWRAWGALMSRPFGAPPAGP
ncbi:MAG: hypothetical protein ACRDQ7_12355 [Haloechinothrix sp.]